MRIRLAVAVAAAALTALCACSSDPSAAPAGRTAARPPAVARVAAAAPGTAVLHARNGACRIVSAAELASTVGVRVTSAEPADPYGFDSVCNFHSAGNDQVIVQITAEPDAYLQEAKFEAMYDGVSPLDVGADRGFVARPGDTGVGHVLVVKNGVGVDVSVSSTSGYGTDGEQALARILAARM